MKTNRLVYGAGLLLLATVAWGGMFPVAKSALTHIDAFYLSLLRYGIAMILFVLLLAGREGWRALRLEGRGRRLWLLGTLGFAGFSFLALIGLTQARPEHGAIIMALMPMITVLVNWLGKGLRPAGFTLVCVGLAFFGVVLVVSQGRFDGLWSGDGLANLLLLLAALCWVLYTLGAAGFGDWSPLRYTTLTAVLGVISMLVITALVTALGLSQAPNAGTVLTHAWEIGYLVVFASVVAVLSWNGGIKTLGAVNGVLFINLVPITAFAIGLAQGHRFAQTEFLGAALTISALVANNLYLRSQTRPVVAPAAD